MFSPQQLQNSAYFLDCCRSAGLRLSLAESCTGGLIAGLLTEIPGSSAILDCGLVTYSNPAKQSFLGVPAALLQVHGAVSDKVAIAMVEGLLAHTDSDIGLAVTGIAGPGGGSNAKPVGLVHFAVMRRNGLPLTEYRIFPGDRTAIRSAAVDTGLELLTRLVAASL